MESLYGDDLYHHCMNVAYLSVQLGIKIGMDLHELIALSMGALLHDIGKTAIDNAILNKPDKLTEEERLVIETHPVLGYHYLWSLDNQDLSKKREKDEKVVQVTLFPKAVMDIVLYHHEKLDGSGYPSHRKDIPLMVQLITVADVYEAIRAKRVYRDANAPKDAYAVVKEMNGLNKDAVRLLGELVE